MKTRIALLALLLIAPGTAFAQGAKLELKGLDRLAALADETVNLDIPAGMLGFAGNMLKGDGDQAAAKALLSALKGIYIRSFEFDRDNMYTADDVDRIRKQLSGPGWTKFISTESKRDRELVEIYSWQEGGVSGGLAILVAEPMELTIVNIVGPFDLAKLPLLQGQFGIPRIPDQPGK
jgi:hypothetical protein